MTAGPEPEATLSTVAAPEPAPNPQPDPRPDLDAGQLSQAELRERVYASQRRQPSPPWVGGLITLGCLGMMALILLTYTLLDWGWQQRLGGWNYVVAAALIPLVSVLMRTWQPDENL